MHFMTFPSRFAPSVQFEGSLIQWLNVGTYGKGLNVTDAAETRKWKRIATMPSCKDTQSSQRQRGRVRVRVRVRGRGREAERQRERERERERERDRDRERAS